MTHPLRHRVLRLAVLCSTAFVGVANADAPPASPDTTVTCEEQYFGRLFSVQMSSRGRYVQTTGIELKQPDDELMRAFQEPGEERLTVIASALHLDLNPNACTISKNNRAHFLECPHATDDAISAKFSQLSFTTLGTSALGAKQTVSTGRELVLANVSIHAEVQRKKGIVGMEDRIVANITVNARVGGQPRALRVTKDLGEWTARTDRSSNDRCFVTAE